MASYHGTPPPPDATHRKVKVSFALSADAIETGRKFVFMRHRPGGRNWVIPAIGNPALPPLAADLSGREGRLSNAAGQRLTRGSKVSRKSDLDFPFFT
jgi:hypothetical protein